MVFRGLLASAVGAAVLGLMASGLVRATFPGILGALVDLPGEAAAPPPPTAEVSPPPAPPPSEPPAPPVDPPAPTLATNTAKVARPARRRGGVTKTGGAHATPRDAFTQTLVDGIRKRGTHAYEIQSTAWELALRNLGALAKSVRVAPAVREGRALGFRLLAVKADGPFAKLGFREQDVLVSVNGLTVANLEQALDTYRKLRSHRHFVLGILRAGQALRQEYTIREAKPASRHGRGTLQPHD
jgi:hypothetical protein